MSQEENLLEIDINNLLKGRLRVIIDLLCPIRPSVIDEDVEAYCGESIFISEAREEWRRRKRGCLLTRLALRDLIDEATTLVRLREVSRDANALAGTLVIESLRGLQWRGV